MKKCTDAYGNLDNDLKVGSVVEDRLAIFTVGEIHDNKLISMDKNKPFFLKKPSDPMVKCIKAGNYAVMATSLWFA